MLEYDREHILHPYAPSNPSSNMTFVKSAKGVYLELEDGKKIIDAMSSWWSVIHGYNVESLNNAAIEQITKMSHVMFGGITHEPAIKLAKKLIEMTDRSLERVFFSDSGSVAVEVALKMAFQYWNSQGNSQKTKILAFSKGYHGDTFGAMSVCDPVTGMHSAFEGILHKNIFADAPGCAYGEKWDEKYIADFASKLEQNHKEIAAVIIEPIVQGAGGMRIYSPEFLKSVRALCDKYDVLLILDEIATGFGRTGKLFAYEHANISADILSVWRWNSLPLQPPPARRLVKCASRNLSHQAVHLADRSSTSRSAITGAVARTPVSPTPSCGSCEMRKTSAQPATSVRHRGCRPGARGSARRSP